ncbi:MAG TPA: hypothetical protein VN420_05725 [Candidatus Fimivivens sp.]|nr:hypothetical protein [Candidatus Fimivivens sp.]
MKKIVMPETAAAIAVYRFLETDKVVRNAYGLGKQTGRNVSDLIERLKSDLRPGSEPGTLTILRSLILINVSFISDPDSDYIFCLSATDRRKNPIGSFFCVVARTTD